MGIYRETMHSFGTPLDGSWGVPEKQQSSDLSTAVRELVTRGRVLLAVERYKSGEASLGNAAEVAGLAIGQMMDVLKEFGSKSRIEHEDYRQSLTNLAGAW